MGSPASMELGNVATNALLNKDDDDHRMIREGRMVCKAGIPRDEEWMKRFYDLHVLKPGSMPDGKWPSDLLESFCAMKKDPTVCSSMLGLDFDVTGTLRNWSVVNKLSNIKVPTLIINGKDDRAQDVCVAPFQKGIGEELARWVKFENSSHMPFWEEPEEYFKVVSDFLTK